MLSAPFINPWVPHPSCPTFLTTTSKPLIVNFIFNFLWSNSSLSFLYLLIMSTPQNTHNYIFDSLNIFSPSWISWTAFPLWFCGHRLSHLSISQIVKLGKSLPTSILFIIHLSFPQKSMLFKNTEFDFWCWDLVFPGRPRSFGGFTCNSMSGTRVKGWCSKMSMNARAGVGKPRPRTFHCDRSKTYFQSDFNFWWLGVSFIYWKYILFTSWVTIWWYEDGPGHDNSKILKRLVQ